MKRAALPLLLFLVMSCASGTESTPAGEESSGAESPSYSVAPPPPPPPLPAPVDGTFAVPVKIPYAIVADLINAQLPAHQSQPRQAITRAGSSPEVVGSFEVWRDPVRVSFADSALVVEVPIRYAGRFDARVKNPLGGSWMTVAKDEPWGTPEAPLTATVRLRTQVEISPQWTLSLKSTIDPPVHGPPPDGKICTQGSFRLCVAKSTVAPHVQAQLNVELQSRVRNAVAQFEREAVQRVSLRSHVQRIYNGMVAPHAAEHGRYMTLTPSGAALSMYAEGDAIVFEPAIEGRLAYHEQQPTVTAPPLPDREPASALQGARRELPQAFLPPELVMLQP